MCLRRSNRVRTANLANAQLRPLPRETQTKQTGDFTQSSKITLTFLFLSSPSLFKSLILKEPFLIRCCQPFPHQSISLHTPKRSLSSKETSERPSIPLIPPIPSDPKPQNSVLLNKDQETKRLHSNVHDCNSRRMLPRMHAEIRECSSADCQTSSTPYSRYLILELPKKETKRHNEGSPAGRHQPSSRMDEIQSRVSRHFWSLRLNSLPSAVSS